MESNYKRRFTLLLVSMLFLLTSCDADFLKKSALELTGGNGAGMSEYQPTPAP
jgi:hypothetical protein